MHDIRENYINRVINTTLPTVMTKLKINLSQIQRNGLKEYLRRKFNARVDEMELLNFAAIEPVPDDYLTMNDANISDNISDISGSASDINNPPVSEVSGISRYDPYLRVFGLSRRQVSLSFGADRQRRTWARKLVRFLVTAGAAASAIYTLLDALKMFDSPEPFPPLPPPKQPDKPVPPVNPPINPDKPPINPDKPDIPVTPVTPVTPTPAVNIDSTGEGLERVYSIDPAEEELFNISKKRAEEEDKMWNEYSFVASGHGLGTVRNNALLRHEALENMKRYTNTIKYAPEYISHEKAYISSKDYNYKKVNMSHDENKNNHWIPIYQNTYGKEHYEDQYFNPYQKNKKVLFTNPYQNTNDTLYDRAVGTLTPNIENPDIALYEKGFSDPKYKQVIEGNVNRPGYYFGLNKKLDPINEPNNKYNNNYISNTKFNYGDTYYEEFGTAILNRQNKINIYANINKYKLAKKNN